MHQLSEPRPVAATRKVPEVSKPRSGQRSGGLSGHSCPPPLLVSFVSGVFGLRGWRWEGSWVADGEGEACLAPVETAASSAGTGQALRETVRELSFPGRDYQFFTRK